MPTQVEKLMLSRVRVMTHSIAMLRSWKNEVVSVSSPPLVVSPPTGCVLGAKVMWLAAEQNPLPPRSSAAEQKQWLGMTSKCATSVPLPEFKPEPYYLVTE